MGQAALVLNFLNALRRNGLQQLTGCFPRQMQRLPCLMVNVLILFCGYSRHDRNLALLYSRRHYTGFQ